MHTERRAAFKQTLSGEAGRRRREETNHQIRKNKKEENLRKRRLGMEKEVVAIANNGSSDISKKKHASVEDIPELTKILTAPSSTEEEILEATRGFRRILSVEPEPPVQAVLDSGALQHLVKNLLANPQNSDLVFESAWALTNIASTSMTSVVVESGAVPSLIQLVSSHFDPEVREQAAWCLGNIAGDDNKEFRDYLLRLGALPAMLLNIRQPAHMSLLSNVTWAVSNLCRGKPAPDIALVGPAVEALADLLDKEISTVVRVDAVWALSYLSDGPNDKIERVMSTGVAKTLVKYLDDKSSKILTPTIRCLGNFVTGSDVQTQAVLDAGLLNHISELFDNPKKSIRKETCWLASNIAAGTHDQITSLLRQPGVLRQLIKLALEASWEVRKEALWAISNICTAGTDTHIQTLVQGEGLQPLADALALQNADTSLLVACLDAIERVLEVGDKFGLSYGRLLDEYNGVDYLENLQEHRSEAVYKKTISIIDQYFGGEEEEDENLAPTSTTAGTFGFGIATPSKELFPTDIASNPAPMTFQFGDASNHRQL